MANTSITRYAIAIYCGRQYVGNGYFDTLDECYAFFINDSFADKAKVIDYTTNNTFTLKLTK